MHGPKLSFPKPFRHDHPPIRNVNELLNERLTAGQRAADLVAATVGSWPFILIQSGLLLIWVILNLTAAIRHWDPYPFILMNLVLSLQAAYTAPLIMMSQSRQTQRDRLEAHQDFEVDVKAETEIRAILDHLSAQDRALEELHRMMISMTAGPPQQSGG